MRLCTISSLLFQLSPTPILTRPVRSREQTTCNTSSAYHAGIAVMFCFISRVPNQIGVSLLYIEGSQPEWCIPTIYRGFPTRMLYPYYIWRVSDQNGVSLLYIMLEIHHSDPEPSISCLRYTILVGNPRFYQQKPLIKGPTQLDGCGITGLCTQ